MAGVRHPSSGTVALVLALGHALLVPGGVAAGEPSAPGTPTGVAAAAGERRATVSWEPPADRGPVTGYVVAEWPAGPEHPAAADATRLVVEGLDPGGRYRFTVTATGEAGAGPVSDPSPEVVLPPDTRITSGPRARSFTTSRSVRFGWATVPAGLDARCTLDRRRVDCAGRRLRSTRLTPGTHAVTVAARDAEGRSDPTPAGRYWTVPRDDRHLEAGPGWRRARDRDAYRGTALRATRRGAVLTSPGIDVRALALVATVGPHAGSVTAFLGSRRLGRFDLRSPVRRTRQVVPLARFNGVRNGRVRLVVRSHGRPVVVDGLGVETWFVVPARAD